MNAIRDTWASIIEEADDYHKSFADYTDEELSAIVESSSSTLAAIPD